MSIILKGIDMPEKENLMYMMELYADGHCSVAKIEDGECYELTIPSETEAIQIPKRHGRLIDEKELKTKIHDVTLEGGVLHGCIDKTVLHEVPTILEAEE